MSNHVADRLGSRSIPLAVCPTGYHGEGDEEYLVTLGSLLDGRVDLFWTGRAICAPAITAAEAVAFARCATSPLYWDNYPVNDVAMIHEAHLGPYRARPARPLQRGRDGQRDGARRGVEDRPGDDRRLSLGAG